MSNLRVIGVSSGKGGVGKTTISSNLAVSLASKGNKVMLFDGDLGLANIQLSLGINPEFNFSHVIAGEKSLSEIIVKGPAGINVVPGASGVGTMADLDSRVLQGIVQGFSDYNEPLDFLVVDTAAGISRSVLTFLQACHQTLIVVRDDPSSIADAYGIIKVLVKEQGYRNIGLVPNGVTDQRSGQILHQRLRAVCLKFLNLDLDYLYSVANDEMVFEAARRASPVVLYAPGTAAASDFRKLAKEVEMSKPMFSTDGSLQFFIERMYYPAEKLHG